MNYPWIDEYLLQLPGAAKDLQPEWGWIRYKVGEKMFAAICLDDDSSPYYITFKLDPAEGDFWQQQYEDFLPGYYMNKLHWNSVRANGSVPGDLLKTLLEKSYHLVLGSFSKKKQTLILQQEDE